MTEQYPDDASLLALTTDDDTGVEYIPTGQSPYVLHFRRMLQRLLLASKRANDFRVYAQGPTKVGVRGGRGVINAVSIYFPGASDIELALNGTHWLWLDAAGDVAQGSSGFPADRSMYLPLAQVTVGAEQIETIADLRGEAIYTTPGLAAQGLTATASEINQALDGINATVDSQALNVLTAGPTSTADSEHRHLQVIQDADGETCFAAINNSSGSAAQVAFALSLPNVLSDDLIIFQDRDHGFIRQRFDGQSLTPVGVLPMSWSHAGALTSSVSDVLLGVVPCDGQVVAAHLSVGTNMASTVGGDGLGVSLSVNGSALTTTDAQLTSDDGTGFRSTAQNDGSPATLASSGVEQVSRGDLVTITCTRTAAGTVSQEASDIAVLLLVRAARPD